MIGLGVLVVVESRVEFPMIDLSLFRIREFSVMTAGGTAANVPIVAAIFLSMIYLQDVLGFTALEAGTAFVVFSNGVMLSFRVSGRMERFRSWAAASLALAAGGLGTIGMGMVDALEGFLACSAVSGFGLGLAIALANTVTQAVVPPEQAGEASGIVLTVTVGFGAVGVAAAASVITPDVGGATAQLESTLHALLIAYGALALAFAPLIALLGRTRPEVADARRVGVASLTCGRPRARAEIGAGGRRRPAVACRGRRGAGAAKGAVVSEARMIEVVAAALRHHGIDDEVLAVGEFYPRGHTAGAFAGGTFGGDLGDAIGSFAGGVGVASGYLAGAAAADAASGLPSKMLVGASATTVYGFASRTRRDEPTQLVFRVPRDQLEVRVHQRVNVRVVELIDRSSGARIELEGNRVPVTHAKDLIDELEG